MNHALSQHAVILYEDSTICRERIVTGTLFLCAGVIR